MDISDIDAELVGNFLEHLETERGNSVRSRNIRLAAIRSFFRHVAVNEPQVLHHCQKILHLPTKRHKRTTVNWLTEDEVKALVGRARPLHMVRTARSALLMLATQTGLRVSELIGLRIRDVELGRVPMCVAMARGARIVATPLRSDTVKVIEAWINEQANVANAPLFPSNRGGPLSRDAVERIVAKHCRTAAETCPSLGEKKVTPHGLRHGAAMALLHRDIGCTVIALWLGHESVETTQVYLHADLRLKEKAMETTRPVGVETGRFKPDNTLLGFLKSL